METFSLSFEEVIWKNDWRNLTLLLKDRFRYVGKDGKQEKEVEMTLEEEIRYLQSINR